MRILRLFADESGESHFGTYELLLNLHDDSPPTKPHYFSDPEQAKTYVVVRCPVGWGGEMHPAPRRQIVFCMSGTMRITTSLGISRDLTPGDAVLLEDTSGNGHISIVTSKTSFPAPLMESSFDWSETHRASALNDRTWPEADFVRRSNRPPTLPNKLP